MTSPASAPVGTAVMRQRTWVEMIMGSVHGQSVAVVQEPVEDGGGQDVVAENLSAFGEALVAGDDHAAAFVAA